MSHQMTALAVMFRRQFGNGEVSVEDFDLFLIDNKAAQDPCTDNPKDPRWKAFVAERNGARRSLNAAGARLYDGQAFMLDVIQAGEVYQMKSLAEGATDAANTYGSKVRLRSDNQFKRLRSLKRAVIHQLENDPGNLQLKAALIKIDHAEKVGMSMNQQIEIATNLFDALVMDAIKTSGIVAPQLAYSSDEDSAA